ncbi:Sec-independent protein translocase protein TatB [Kibdelosporangium phytohabitans]|uniref:Sec-independent protein translocase protein TatB n=1 Tax=Kibdelosporangium phytohabitans TaxID=860235 RepID=A0A0N9HX97_9PSEU|nr:Sec-independent protein translocase protein TatB [Kibdelosporangium phytohabitans]ALG06678.1 preprotein translocase subunit TatB [Kibdelosporangium phytohabitans]MBE1467895.1 sec-independent protein translocase protein TatB [Kibdelosporangium phytohabitans]
MFESIGWLEILVLLLAGLFILGPERLPSAAAWIGKSIRKVREFATGARDQLRNEMGPEFDELRKPLENLRELRSFDPKRMVTQHLFNDEPANGSKPNGYTPPPPAPPATQTPPPLNPGEKPPFDPDAT